MHGHARHASICGTLCLGNGDRRTGNHRTLSLHGAACRPAHATSRGLACSLRCQESATWRCRDRHQCSQPCGRCPAGTVARNQSVAFNRSRHCKGDLSADAQPYRFCQRNPSEVIASADRWVLIFQPLAAHAWSRGAVSALYPHRRSCRTAPFAPIAYHAWWWRLFARELRVRTS